MSDYVENSKGPISWMVKNPVAANLLMLLFLVGGLITFFQIQQEIMPDLVSDSVSISVSYPGGTPEEMEQSVCLVVEEAVRGLEGVDEVRSVASEGRASVSAELLEGIDRIKVYQDIKSEIDRVTTFPDGAERPVVSLSTRRRDAMSLIIYGDASDLTLRNIAEQVRDRVLQNENITQVDLRGTRNLEISVEVSQEDLRRYGFTHQSLAAVIRNQSREISGGGIKTNTGETLLRMQERRNIGTEFSQVPILATEEGTLLKLGDIANVIDAFEDSDRSASFNGKPAIMLEIYRVGEQTPSQISNSVYEMLPQIREQLPEGIGIEVLRDSTQRFSQRASLLLRNGALGLVLVLGILSLFLQMRLAFWVMMGIPISFLGCMLLMPVADLTINSITLFAFIVSLGMVVDDAIVVGENIYHKLQDGYSPKEAAIRGTKEVGTPVGFSILTNIVAFIPIALMPGTTGRYFGMLPIVVIAVFIISWVESLYILPAHLSHISKHEPRGLPGLLHRYQQRFSYAFRQWVRTKYSPFLDFCLSHRYLVISLAFSVLLVFGGYWGSGRMGYSIYPAAESDYASATVMLPFGSPVEKVEAVADKLIQGAAAVWEESGHPELVTGIFGDVGSGGGGGGGGRSRGGSNSATVRAYLADPDIREKMMSTETFVQKWREKVGQIPGVRVIRYASDEGGPGSGPALTVELRHEDIRTLEKAAQALAAELNNYPLVQDVDDGVEEGKKQFDFTMKPEGLSLGLTASNVGQQVRAAFEGIEVLRQQRGRNEVKVRVRLPKEERTRMHNFENFVLRTPDGGEVMLTDVVNVIESKAYTSINRRNGLRTLELNADVQPKSKVGTVMNRLDTEYFPRLMQEYPGLDYSYEGRFASSRESFQSMAVTVPIVLLAIYALLAVPFRSYIQPLIVMLSIPFGIVGAIIGHLIMGYEMSLVGVIGMVALSGVVVNDSLVLVNFANRRRAENYTTREAIIFAGVQRFRPIILTTLTTFGGLAPMILETSRTARQLIPLAISLGFGILFATVIALLIVPCLYMAIDDFHKLSQRSRGN